MVYVFGIVFRRARTVARVGADSAVVLLFYLIGIAGLVAIATSWRSGAGDGRPPDSELADLGSRHSRGQRQRGAQSRQGGYGLSAWSGRLSSLCVGPGLRGRLCLAPESARDLVPQAETLYAPSSP